MATEQQLKDVLVKHSLKNTPARLDVLTVFNSYVYALSHSDIENAIGEGTDRVTLYRTLKSFEDKGIIHKVMDGSSVEKYALCAAECNDHAHNDEHIHFSCTACGNTFCFDHVELPKINIPDGYKTTGIQILAQGICKDCQKA